jgi:ABC-type glycerol-3-phosphate transport system permease component
VATLETPKAGRRARIVATSLVAAVAFLFVFPLYWMVVLSTHTNADVYRFPPPLLPGSALPATWDRLVEAIDLARALGNSLFVAVVHTALVLFLCSLAGYAFSRFRAAPGSGLLFNLMLITLFVPPTVGLIPWYILIKELGWVNTFWPLIVPAAANAFGIFWMRQFVDEAIPVELYEAARVDGASDWWIYARVVVPLIRPGLAALAVWTFLSTWNNFQLPLIVLNDPEKFTMPLALTSLNALYRSDTAAVMLGTTIGVLPVLIAFLLGTRHFIAGLTAGAVK